MQPSGSRSSLYRSASQEVEAGEEGSTAGQADRRPSGPGPRRRHPVASRQSSASETERRYRFQGAARETWDPGGAEGRQTHPPNPGPPRPNTGASSQQGGEASEATPTEVLESDGTTATTDPLGGEEGEGTAEGEGQGEEEGEEEVEHPPRKRARKKKREPGVPVRPRSGFLLFLNDFRPRYLAIHPRARVAEVSTKAGATWRELSAEERQPYERLSEEDKARYAAEKEAVVAKAGKVEREEGQPPRPKGPFFYFLAAFKEQYKHEHPGAVMMMKNISQMASKAWAELSRDQRQVFEQQAEGSKAAYRAWKAAKEAAESAAAAAAALAAPPPVTLPAPATTPAPAPSVSVTTSRELSRTRSRTSGRQAPVRPPEQLPAPAAPPRPPLPPVSTQPEVPVARVPRIQEDLRLLAGVPLRRTQPPAVGFQPVRPAAQPTQELPPQPPSPSEISLVQRIQQLVEQQLIDLHAIAPAIVPEAPCQPLTAPPAEAQPLVPTPAAQPPPETLPSGLELAVQQLQYVQQFRAAIEAQIALAQQVPHQPPPPQVAPALVVPEGPPPGGPAGAPWLAALPAWVGATLPQPAAPIFPEGAAPAPLIGHLYPFQPTTPLESAVLRSSPARPAAARLPVWPALQPPSLPHMGAPPVQRPVPPTGAPPSVQPLITPGPLHADFDFEAFLACPQDFLTDQQAQLLQALLARSPTGRTQPAAAPTAPLPAPVPHVGAVVSEAGVQLEGAVQASGPAPAQLLLPFAGVPLSGPEAQSQGHVVEEERHTEEIQDESGETGSNDGGEGQVT